MDLPVEQIVRTHARRRMVEKAISKQIEFFHLNKASSSTVEILKKVYQHSDAKCTSEKSVIRAV